MKADKVLECLRENETLLIIDRLESYQHPGISQKGGPTEESLRDLIEGLGQLQPRNVRGHLSCRSVAFGESEESFR